MTSPLFPDEASRFSALVQAIALSVGPCYWPKSFEQDNPFLKLEDCLRDRQAAHAKKRDDRYLQSWVSRKKLSKETAEKLRQSPYCNHPIYPPPGVQKDELDEVFSHWFTAEVLAQTIAFKDTVLRADLCELSHRARRLEPGLSPQDTLQRIYYAQPQIKDRLNLTPKYKYCPLEL